MYYKLFSIKRINNIIPRFCHYLYIFLFTEHLVRFDLIRLIFIYVRKKESFEFSNNKIYIKSSKKNSNKLQVIQLKYLVLPLIVITLQLGIYYLDYSGVYILVQTTTVVCSNRNKLIHTQVQKICYLYKRYTVTTQHTQSLEFKVGIVYRQVYIL